jgi:hypothetical protein
MISFFYSTPASLLTAMGFAVTTLNIVMLVVALAWAFGVAILVYLLPAFIAEERKHQHRIPTFLLNLLMGWTFVGWVVSLVWAAMPMSPPPLPSTEIERQAA